MSASSEMKDFIIREAIQDDEDAICNLWKLCDLVASYNDPNLDFRFAIKDASSTTSRSTVLVAEEKSDKEKRFGNGNGDGSEENPHLVGSIMVGHDGHRGWLYYVAVSPQKQKSGIGSKLIKVAEEWLKSRGVNKVQLLIREDNTKVINFYERIGFQVTPRVVMAKWLT